MRTISCVTAAARAALLRPLHYHACWMTFLGAAALPVMAQTTSSLGETVVTATRTAQPLTDLVADVSVLDRAAIERSGAASIEDLLNQLPGVQVSRTGAAGSTSGVYVRGASNEFTAVYLDGIRLDSQSGAGGAPWEVLPLELVERVELMRGPAGAVYGSDAVGGVIQIFTRRGESNFAPTAEISAGTHGTVRAAAGLSGAQGAWDYALSVSRAKSRGYNSRVGADFSPDRDGHDRKAWNARLGFRPVAGHRLEVTALQADARTDYDISSSDEDESHYALQAVGVNWQGQWSAHHTSRVSVSESHNDYTTQPPYYRTETVLRNALLQHEWQTAWGTWTAAYERREDRLSNSDMRGGHYQRHQDALALGWGWRQAGHVLQLQARHDQDSTFGGKTTGSAAYAWQFHPQWRVHASAGTAFRAPTLYQRFSEFGEAGLRPQTSRNLEVGVRWGQGADHVALTAYRNRVKHLIGYVGGPGRCASDWGCYENVDQARYEGLTLAAVYRWAGVQWRGSLDWQNPRNERTGQRLPRRAPRYASVAADTVWQGWNLGVQMQASAHRLDNDYESHPPVLGGFAVWNLSASRALDADWTLWMRVDNVADKAYQWVNTYEMPGRTFQVGLKWAPR